MDDMIGTKEEAVAEIRRLDAVNKKLVDALKEIKVVAWEGDSREYRGYTIIEMMAKAALQELNKE